jgi:hypothetical protein
MNPSQNNNPNLPPRLMTGNPIGEEDNAPNDASLRRSIGLPLQPQDTPDPIQVQDPDQEAKQLTLSSLESWREEYQDIPALQSIVNKHLPLINSQKAEGNGPRVRDFAFDFVPLLMLPEDQAGIRSELQHILSQIDWDMSRPRPRPQFDLPTMLADTDVVTGGHQEQQDGEEGDREHHRDFFRRIHQRGDDLREIAEAETGRGGLRVATTNSSDKIDTQVQQKADGEMTDVNEDEDDNELPNVKEHQNERPVSTFGRLVANPNAAESMAQFHRQAEEIAKTRREEEERERTRRRESLPPHAGFEPGAFIRVNDGYENPRDEWPDEESKYTYVPRRDG